MIHRFDDTEVSGSFSNLAQQMLDAEALESSDRSKTDGAKRNENAGGKYNDTDTCLPREFPCAEDSGKVHVCIANFKEWKFETFCVDPFESQNLLGKLEGYCGRCIPGHGINANDTDKHEATYMTWQKTILDFLILHVAAAFIFAAAGLLGIPLRRAVT